MTDDITPMVPKAHRHYFTNVVQVKNIFESYEGPYDGLPFKSPVYQMVEYAYMACNCGAVIKSRVRSEDHE